MGVAGTPAAANGTVVAATARCTVVACCARAGPNRIVRWAVSSAGGAVAVRVDGGVNLNGAAAAR